MFPSDLLFKFSCLEWFPSLLKLDLADPPSVLLKGMTCSQDLITTGTF